MGRWRAFLTLSNIARFHKLSSNPNNNSSPRHLNPQALWLASNSARTQFFSSSRGFSAAAPSPSPFYADDEELDYRGAHDFGDNHHEEDAEAGKIPIKSYFLCTRFPSIIPLSFCICLMCTCCISLYVCEFFFFCVCSVLKVRLGARRPPTPCIFRV